MIHIQITDKATGRVLHSADVDTDSPVVERPEPQPTGIVRADAERGLILGPAGKPLPLRGWRVQRKSYDGTLALGYYDNAALDQIEADGLLGNCHAVEIWWASPGSIRNREAPCESDPRSIGVYNTAGIQRLLACLRAIAARGVWIVPSIRVSYDSAVVEEAAKTGGAVPWQGWATHNAVIRNEPIRWSGKEFGRARDRFFAWLDWLIPQILADDLIRSRLAYWEMWHYPGHRSAMDFNAYFADFVPAMLAHYRKHEPKRCLGISLNSKAAVEWLTNNASRVKLPKDDNILYHVGGYGILRLIMPKDAESMPTGKVWPQDSGNPKWLGNQFDFEAMRAALEQSGQKIVLHAQEGPGLEVLHRSTPMDPYPKSWLAGLLNLYNAKTQGFTIHAWPPSWKDRDASIDERAYFEIVRKAFRGESV